MTIETTATDEASIRELADFLFGLYGDARLPVDVEKTLEQVYSVASRGHAFALRGVERRLIASLGLVTVAPFYSRRQVLANLWFYISPAARFSHCCLRLVRHARELADEMDMGCEVTLLNPMARQPSTEFALVAQTVGYIPLGRTIRIR